MLEEFVDNNDYWNNFYKNSNIDLIHAPSSFAIFCKENYIQKKSVLVEIGSGNGRDSFYFAKHGHKVHAIDLSQEAVNLEKKVIEQKLEDNICLINDNFVTYDYNKIENIDIFYSRFTMHTINESEEIILLEKIYTALKIGGEYFVEARTINDPLIKEGKKISQNEMYTDHYRRFLNSGDFLKKCLKLGFELKYFTEKSGLSIYKNDDPVLLRMILKKVI